MGKCKFCLYREGCIGEIPGKDGRCMGFAVPPEQKAAYESYLAGQAKKPDFAALCRE